MTIGDLIVTETVIVIASVTETTKGPPVLGALAHDLLLPGTQVAIITKRPAVSTRDRDLALGRLSLFGGPSNNRCLVILSFHHRCRHVDSLAALTFHFSINSSIMNKYHLSQLFQFSCTGQWPLMGMSECTRLLKSNFRESLVTFTSFLCPCHPLKERRVSL